MVLALWDGCVLGASRTLRINSGRVGKWFGILDFGLSGI